MWQRPPAGSGTLGRLRADTHSERGAAGHTVAATGAVDTDRTGMGRLAAAALGVAVVCARLPGAGSLVVLQPAGLGPFDHVTAGFGPELPTDGIEREAVWAAPVDACMPIAGCVPLLSPPANWDTWDPAKVAGNPATRPGCAGKILMIRRGNCDFFKKILHVSTTPQSSPQLEIQAFV